MQDTFYRYKAAVEEGGIAALIDKSRRKPNLKNRVDSNREKAVVECAIEYPAHEQHRASNELRKRGVFVSGSGVRCVWVRNNLTNFKSRLVEQHDYELYLAINDIEHTKQRPNLPKQTVYVSDSIRLYCKSFIKLLSENMSTMT